MTPSGRRRRSGHRPYRPFFNHGFRRRRRQRLYVSPARLIGPVLDSSQETGIQTEVLFLDKGPRAHRGRGVNSPADVIMTVDISRLTAAGKGVTQALDDAVITGNWLASIAFDGHWFGVTKRARVIYAPKDRVAEDAITYADLADLEMERPHLHPFGQHDCNLALFSAMIDHWGEADGVDARPEGESGAQAGRQRPRPAKSIFAGECDIDLANLPCRPDADQREGS